MIAPRSGAAGGKGGDGGGGTAGGAGGVGGAGGGADGSGDGGGGGEAGGVEGDCKETMVLIGPTPVTSPPIVRELGRSLIVLYSAILKPCS